MADFRIKFIGLAAAATLFAGMSFGQGTTGQLNCSAANGGSQTINPGSPILVRAESEADLVSDVLISCPNQGTAVSNGQLTVFSSLPITSKGLASQANSVNFFGGGNSDAVLIITSPAAGGAGSTNVIYQGTVSGTILTFTGVSFPASFSARIANVRVNASGAGVGSTPLAVTESVFAGTNGLATYVNNNIVVGYALKSLVNPAFTVSTVTNLPIVNNYTVCTGNSAAFTVPGLSFTVVVAETFGGFFKTQTGADFTVGGATVVQNGEQGSFVNGAFGTAASGTEISLAFANVPSVATIYVPLTITAANGATLTLVSSTTAATSPAGVVNLNGGVAGFTPSSGALSVVYQVTASSAALVESFNVPVYVTFASNAAGAQGPITVLESYAPAIAFTTGLPSSIPVFAPSSATPLNASSISICQTTLLFPFLTNQLGFDSGIAIMNTSIDPLGTGGKSLASSQGGTCTLNFYGAGVTGGFLSAPAPNPGGGTGAFTLGAGGTNAFLLSSVAPGFQGYMIANCSFLYAHGFTYITYNLTQNNGVAMGYLAEVLSTNRSTAGGNPEGVTF